MPLPSEAVAQGKYLADGMKAYLQLLMKRLQDDHIIFRISWTTYCLQYGVHASIHNERDVEIASSFIASFYSDAFARSNRMVLVSGISKCDSETALRARVKSTFTKFGLVTSVDVGLVAQFHRQTYCCIVTFENEDAAAAAISLVSTKLYEESVGIQAAVSPLLLRSLSAVCSVLGVSVVCTDLELRSCTSILKVQFVQPRSGHQRIMAALVDFFAGYNIIRLVPCHKSAQEIGKQRDLAYVQFKTEKEAAEVLKDRHLATIGNLRFSLTNATDQDLLSAITVLERQWKMVRKRPTKVLLIRGLPFGWSAQTVLRVCSGFQLASIVRPSRNFAQERGERPDTVAYVEFLSESACEQVFSSMNFCFVENRFLEFFLVSVEEMSSASASPEAFTTDARKLQGSLVKRSEHGRNIHVVGLPTDATEAAVKQFFQQCGDVESLELFQNCYSGVHCFVTFREVESAEVAITRSRNKVLLFDGCVLACTGRKFGCRSNFGNQQTGITDKGGLKKIDASVIVSNPAQTGAMVGIQGGNLVEEGRVLTEVDQQEGHARNSVSTACQENGNYTRMSQNHSRMGLGSMGAPNIIDDILSLDDLPDKGDLETVDASVIVSNPAQTGAIVGIQGGNLVEEGAARTLVDQQQGHARNPVSTACQETDTYTRMSLGSMGAPNITVDTRSLEDLLNPFAGSGSACFGAVVVPCSPADPRMKGNEAEKNSISMAKIIMGVLGRRPTLTQGVSNIVLNGATDATEEFTGKNETFPYSCQVQGTLHELEKRKEQPSGSSFERAPREHTTSSQRVAPY